MAGGLVVGDVSLPVAIQRNDNHRAENQYDAEGEPQGEELAKEEDADQHGGEGLECPHDGGGRGTDVFGGIHHHHQGEDGGHSTDAARNKVQTMPGDGGATVKIELPRNWDQLMEELGYEALKEFYIKRRFACDHHSARSSTPSSPHHSDYYSISDIYCSIWALRSGRSTSITFQIPSSSIW